MTQRLPKKHLSPFRQKREPSHNKDLAEKSRQASGTSSPAQIPSRWQGSLGNYGRQGSTKSWRPQHNQRCLCLA